MRNVWRKAVASYLRALAAVAGGIQIGVQADWVAATFDHQMLMTVLGAAIAPIIMVLTGSADILDHPESDSNV